MEYIIGSLQKFSNESQQNLDTAQMASEDLAARHLVTVSHIESEKEMIISERDNALKQVAELELKLKQACDVSNKDHKEALSTSANDCIRLREVAINIRAELKSVKEKNSKLQADNEKLRHRESSLIGELETAQERNTKLNVKLKHVCIQSQKFISSKGGPELAVIAEKLLHFVESLDTTHGNNQQNQVSLKNSSIDENQLERKRRKLDPEVHVNKEGADSMEDDSNSNTLSPSLSRINSAGNRASDNDSIEKQSSEVTIMHRSSEEVKHASPTKLSKKASYRSPASSGVKSQSKLRLARSDSNKSRTLYREVPIKATHLNAAKHATSNVPSPPSSNSDGRSPSREVVKSSSSSSSDLPIESVSSSGVDSIVKRKLTDQMSLSLSSNEKKYRALNSTVHPSSSEGKSGRRDLSSNIIQRDLGEKETSSNKEVAPVTKCSVSSAQPSLSTNIQTVPSSKSSSSSSSVSSSSKQSSVIGKQPEFCYREVVRKKKDREALPGHTCEMCGDFVQGLIAGGALASENKSAFLGLCSRHKDMNPVQDTPENFWELSFNDSMEGR